MRQLMLGLGAVALVLGGAAQAIAPDRTPAYDTIIRGGTIVDGSGSPRYKGDVAIKGSRIIAVGDLGDARAATVIDATGLFVAPGFINIHSHSEPAAVATAVNMLTQGVTSEIINADGYGTTDIGSQLAQFGANGLAENLGAYVGFNVIWYDTVGEEDRSATPAEIALMRKHVEDNLDRGAWGVSAGLDYKPAYYASADQVVEVVSAARPWRTNFPNHDRVRPEEGYSSYKGMAETIAIAERAGLVPVITHMKSQGNEQGNAPRVIEMMRAATARGTYTASDVYPYLAGQTGLGSLIIPGWAQAGGRDAMLARFKDPTLRARIIAEGEKAMSLRFGGPKGVYVLDTGEELTAAMQRMNAGAGETVIRLLEESNYGVILRFGIEQDLTAFLGYRDSAMACDCGATLEKRVHPRNYGSFPRVLGHYVRETGVLRWENAIRKMTALPATVIGMVDRGYLAPGMVADVTVFDPATVADRATFEAPTIRSEGIRHVFVHGQQALKDGAPTGAKGGQVLLRDRHMPSRPMTAWDSNRSIGAAGASPDYAIRFAVTQRSGARLASGRVELTDRKSRTTWVASQVGTLQTTGNWASFTVAVRDKAGALKPLVVTVDHVDGKGGRPAILVSLDGGPWATIAPAGRIRIAS